MRLQLYTLILFSLASCANEGQQHSEENLSIDSLQTTFYENGEVKRTTNWKGAKKFGIEKEYYNLIYDTFYTVENNDTIRVVEQMRKAYRFYDIGGNVKYERLYDEDGNIIKEAGDVIVLVGHSPLNIELGNKLRVDYFIADPDFVDNFFKVLVLNENEQVIFEDTLEFNEDHKAFFFNYTPSSEGTYYVNGIVKNTDQMFSHSLTDTATLTIKVK